MSNEIFWNPNPSGVLAAVPKSRLKKTLRVSTSATPDEATQVSISQVRYAWALLKASDDNSASAGEEIFFGHSEAADFDNLAPGSTYVDSGYEGRVLDFQNLWIKSAAASQDLTIEYLEP